MQISVQENVLENCSRIFELFCQSKEDNIEAEIDKENEVFVENNETENDPNNFVDNSNKEQHYVHQRSKERRDLAAERLAQNFKNSLQNYRKIKKDLDYLEKIAKNPDDTGIFQNRENLAAEKSDLSNKIDEVAYQCLTWLQRYSKLNYTNFLLNYIVRQMSVSPRSDLCKR